MCSCIAILSVSLVNFTAIIFCVASQPVSIVVSVYFVIDSDRKLLDTPSYINQAMDIRYPNFLLTIILPHLIRHYTTSAVDTGSYNRISECRGIAESIQSLYPGSPGFESRPKSPRD
jgi:hypothetical protein